MASNVKSVAVADGTLVDLAAGMGCTYYGYALRETAAGTAVVRIRVGTVAGQILDTIRFAANESKSEWYGPQGVFCDGDLYCEVVSGTLEGSVRYG